MSDVDLFFLSPGEEMSRPNRFSVLYLLRRDINQCMGFDSRTQQDVGEERGRALFPGAMAMLAGIDLLAKFFAGSDETGSGEVGKRFRGFLESCFAIPDRDDREVVYQLRNSLMHSFGLYSRVRKANKDKVYRFVLTFKGTGPLISRGPSGSDRYYIDLLVLYREFNKAVEAYRTKLNAEPALQGNFDKMFSNYGSIQIDE